MTTNQNLRFAKGNNQFFTILNQRVNQYFKLENISKHANAEMIFKTIFMLSLYFIPYLLVVNKTITSLSGMFLACILMGFGIAGIGLSIMHDANHGSYSNKPWLNNLLGLTLNMVGGNAFNWKVQHNVLHHTYTNIHDVDEDISPRGVLRMAPGSPWKPMHQFQHWYAWFFYGLLTLVWIFFKDFSRIIKYQKEGFLMRQKASTTVEWIILVATKAIYFGYILIIPMVLLDITLLQWFIGFLSMHYLSGFILAIIFQPAHVVVGTEYPVPDPEGNLENNWAIHQMHTTTNFANKNRILSWYVGGLNFQVEHHLFPQICHVHYRKISHIVESTAKEFGVPYKKKETFIKALIDHAQLMKVLGRKPEVAMTQA